MKLRPIKNGANFGPTLEFNQFWILYMYNMLHSAHQAVR